MGSSRADASPVQSEMSKQAQPQQIAFLGVMGLIPLKGAVIYGLFTLAGVFGELAAGITSIRRWRGRRI